MVPFINMNKVVELLGLFRSRYLLWNLRNWKHITKIYLCHEHVHAYIHAYILILILSCININSVFRLNVSSVFGQEGKEKWQNPTTSMMRNFGTRRVFLFWYSLSKIQYVDNFRRPHTHILISITLTIWLWSLELKTWSGSVLSHCSPEPPLLWNCVLCLKDKLNAEI